MMEHQEEARYWYWRMQPGDAESESCQEEMTPLLERLMPHFAGRMEMNDVFDALAAGKLTAWIFMSGRVTALDAIALVEVVQYPKGKVCRFAGLAGDNMDEWLDTLVDAVESWARQQDCTHMEIAGRKGWERKMPGYELRHVILERRL